MRQNSILLNTNLLGGFYGYSSRRFSGFYRACPGHLGHYQHRKKWRYYWIASFMGAFDFTAARCRSDNLVVCGTERCLSDLSNEDRSCQRVIGQGVYPAHVQCWIYVRHSQASIEYRNADMPMSAFDITKQETFARQVSRLR